MNVKCDKKECDEESVWTIYAAHDVKCPMVDVHPHFARYPMPMIRACNEHVVNMLMDDTKKLATTAQWVIKPALRIEDNGS